MQKKESKFMFTITRIHICVSVNTFYS